MPATNTPEIIKVDADKETVSCDGGAKESHGALGHPKVYYTFDGAAEIVCGYCDRIFVKKEQAA